MMKNPPKRKHDRPLQVRVSAEMAEYFQRAAAAAGLSLSGWARDRLLQTARRELKSIDKRERGARLPND